MNSSRTLKRSLVAVLAWSILAGTSLVAQAADMPPDMKTLIGTPDPAPGSIETNNVLALNNSMFELYGSASKVFTKNILANHPVILGLFSGAGGSFTLYRPGQPPLEAASVPVVYQLLKSVSHSTMALAQVVGPYLDNPKDTSWRAPMLAFRSRMQSALDGVDATAMQKEWQDNNRTILKANIAFMDGRAQK